MKNNRGKDDGDDKMHAHNGGNQGQRTAFQGI